MVTKTDVVGGMMMTLLLRDLPATTLLDRLTRYSAMYLRRDAIEERVRKDLVIESS
jgi:hypothetical protein